MKLGRKLFYDKVTRNILVDTGEWSNAPRDKTIEEEIATYPILSERNRETFDVLELPYGAYSQDFREGRLIGVDLETKIPIFEYPNPENPDEPIIAEKPLTVQIAEVKEDNQALSDTLEFILINIIPSMMGGGE